MGGIKLHSALNQPLNAEIELLDVADLSADDIRVVLASNSDFARAGVERLAFLQDLSFTPVVDGNRSRIRVASNRPVREPYLNFLVEITRAKSRLLREYTVLLDPLPSTGEATGEVAVSVPQVSALFESAKPESFVPPAELPQVSQGKHHRVMSGESLWTIAGAYAGGGAQALQAQFMRDIQALNPDAFSGGDPGRLKAGSNLLLPDTAKTDSTRNAEPGNAVPVTEATIQSQSIPDSELADPALLNEQVATLRRQLFDELAASRDENQQLKQMLTDMQGQLEAVTAQLIEQRRSQTVALPQLDQSASETDADKRSVAGPAPDHMAVAKPASSFRWQDWTLPGGGVLASLLLGGLWFGRRRKAHAASPESVAAAVAQPMRVPPVAAAAALEMPRQPAHASVSETDVLEAADIYLTYGRRDEALDVLQRGIERAPEQLDVRLRHLGLLAESGDVDSYSTSADGYLQAGGSQAQLDQLLTLHPALASAFASVDPSSDSPLDSDVTFVLNEFSPVPLVGLASTPVEPCSSADGEQVSSVDSQPWLDDFDDNALTLGNLPTLFEDSCSFASMSTTEELRQLEPNPEHLVRLNQAVAYIKQGDMDSACIILESLAVEGDEQQRQQVNELLAQIA
ncbi:hypothetical protein CH92_12585 [Stutzerimonas stutzeri]|uniref:FimV N-terminal domain-containing protein n=1 Tax=Stutzerimonas stutzeri TaxID=316 RepID=W8R403_STUST|nr:hypothetical protein CH92_12585 [Stutzerimonas stutzeri]